MSLSKTILLSSSDGETIEVDEAVAMESQTIQHMIETGGADHTAIVLPQVTGKTLSKVIEYCKKHVESAPNYNEDDLKSFDADFIKVEQSLLFDLIQAAHDLSIESLLELGCKTVADMIKYKNPEQIRQTFNIVNDFTPEEQEEMDRENARVSIIYPNPSSSS